MYAAASLLSYGYAAVRARATLPPPVQRSSPRAVQGVIAHMRKDMRVCQMLHQASQSRSDSDSTEHTMMHVNIDNGTAGFA